MLSRDAPPVTVAWLSANLTQVSIPIACRLGNFLRKEVRRRQGTYVVVGVRPGYRDVRMEFRVAPELVMEPLDIRCEEQI